jgi:carboxypeptidase family protein
MRSSLSTVVVVVCLFLSVPCFAQTNGVITGEVRDSTGAIVPGATVTAQNRGTNALRTAQSNNAGVYNFPALPPGGYTVKAELQGFRTVSREVELQVAQTARVDFTLAIGDITEAMEVTGVAPLMTTENATVGTVIENRRIVELPLNGRNYLTLIALSPNVSAEFAGPGQAGARQGGTRAGQQLSISGQRREFNYFTLDGVDNTDVNFNTYIFMPSIDSLEEFKVQTGIYSAEFGRGASQINVVTKSGTNSLHGAVFEFVRNDKFDAKNYAFTPAQAATPKAPFKWNQYGYTAGGPIWKNKLFFMSNFEGYRDRKQFQNLYNVPSKAMRTGDFSELLPGTAILDPTKCTVVGATRNCAAFPGNIIPTTRLDSTAIKLLEFYPEPTGPGLSNNLVVLANRRIDKDQFTQRIDFVQSSQSTWYGRYSWGNESELAPALKLNGTKLLTEVQQLMVGNTRTISTSMVNEVRFGYNHFFNTYGRELAFVRDVVGELKIPGLAAPPPEAWGIPEISIQNFSTFGDSTEGPYTNRNHVFEVSDNLSWMRGKHSLRLGGSLRFDRFNQIGNQFARGSFIVENQATGYSFSDYMLGYTRRDEASVALANAKFRATSQAYYVDDTWKVRQDLTVNMGVRYEYTPPWFDANGTLVNAYVPFLDTTANVQDRSRHPVLIRIGEGDFYEGTPLRFNPDIQVSRDGRLGKRLINDDKKNFAPRLGIAWSPNERWSVRSGVGMFYTQDTGNPRFDMARNLAGRRRDESVTLEPDLTFQSPFRGASANACGVDASKVCISTPYVLANSTERKTPYMIQYLFNIQRELGPSTAVEFGYLGSTSRRLERLVAYNEALPGATGTVISRQPYPEFGRIQEVANVGEAKYNSLTMKLTRRLNAGLSVLAGYTLSKSTDTGSGIRTLDGDPLFPQNSYCVECERGLSIFDVRHRFVSSILYELPFGADKPHLKNGLGSVLLGGWQVSQILSLSSGFPRTITTGTDRANTGAGSDRPNKTGVEPNLPGDERTILRWFDTSAYSLEPLGTFGDAGRNTVFGPGIFSWDASLLRNFRVARNHTLQFRLEAFNLPNRPIWNDPNTTFTSPNFGRILTTRRPMREMQFGVKYIF